MELSVLELRHFSSRPTGATNMVDAVGTNVYSYTAGNQLLTEDGPFASDTVIYPVRNVRLQRKRLLESGSFAGNGIFLGHILFSRGRHIR